LKRRVPLLLVVPVLLAHLGVGEWVQRTDLALRAESGTPPPIEVTFVQEMKQTRLLTAAQAPPRAPRSRLAHLAAQGEVQIGSVEPPDVPPPAQPVSAPAPVAQAAQDGEPGPEWPLSTRLDYTLTGYYRGEVTGSASVEWRRDGAHYQVALAFSVGGIVSRSMTSDGRLGLHGIVPQRYDELTKVILMAPRQVSMSFGGQALTLANGDTQPQPDGVQDTASQFVQLTWLFLTGRATMQPGTVVDIPLALPRRLYAWRYTVKEQELLSTPIGELQAWHLVPSRADAPISGDLTADVWLAPALQYLPVRLVIRQDAQTYVDLMLSKAPVQAAAPQSPPPNSKESP